MLHILGVGAAYPSTTLSDEVIRELVGECPNAAFLARTGTVMRKSSLPLDYIRQTKNQDVLGRRAAALESPTDLAMRATHMALERAGIKAEQLGLVIGDCVTPYQTTPSEGQRVAGRLGLKVPAYDITCGPAALSLLLETILNWNSDRLPEYILCISSNTPTQHVHFREGALEPWIFGDAAGAIVLSTKATGKLSLVESYLKKDSAQKPVLEIDRHVALLTDRMMPKNEVVQLVAQMNKRFSEHHKVASDRLTIIGPELYGGDLKNSTREIGVENDRLLTSATETGFALGSSAFCSLSGLWNKINPGDHVLAVHAGDGVWSGCLMFSHV